MAPIVIDSYRNVEDETVGKCNRCGSESVVWQISKRTNKRYLCEIFDIEGEPLFSHADFHSRYCNQSPAVKEARLSEIMDAALSDDDDDDVPQDGKPHYVPRRVPHPRRGRRAPSRTQNFHNSPPVAPEPEPSPNPEPLIDSRLDSSFFSPTTLGKNMSDSIYFSLQWNILEFANISKAQKGAEILLTQTDEHLSLTERATMLDMWLHLQWRLQNEMP